MLFDQSYNENSFLKEDSNDGNETVGSGLTQEVLDKNYKKSKPYKNPYAHEKQLIGDVFVNSWQTSY